jgi:hypothetical protein
MVFVRRVGLAKITSHAYSPPGNWSATTTKISFWTGTAKGLSKIYGNREGLGDSDELHSKVVDYTPDIYAEVLDFSYAVRNYTDKHLVIRVGETIFGNAMGDFQAQIDSIQNHETKMHDFAKIATDHLVLRYQKEGT